MRIIKFLVLKSVKKLVASIPIFNRSSVEIKFTKNIIESVYRAIPKRFRFAREVLQYYNIQFIIIFKHISV